jgi:hypothetical protein
MESIMFVVQSSALRKGAGQNTNEKTSFILKNICIPLSQSLAKYHQLSESFGIGESSYKR